MARTQCKVLFPPPRAGRGSDSVPSVARTQCKVLFPPPRAGEVARTQCATEGAAPQLNLNSPR
jgi:hypothetical protein